MDFDAVALESCVVTLFLLVARLPNYMPMILRRQIFARRWMWTAL